MTDEPKKPTLAVVAENSQKQIDTEYAQQRVDRAMVELAANIMRVVRGAGKPEELIRQCVDVVNTAVAFDEVTHAFPSPFSLATAIQLKHDPLEHGNAFWVGRQTAYRKMVSGALQFSASRLLGQLTQERRGESEMDEAFRNLEGAHEALRKRRATEEREARGTANSGKKPAKKKAKVEISL
ncbi:hypothetical protein G6M87_09355 [Rhizobium rhizogenes]|uniref:hypothetical protein n=1 Tax=Rhizobium rhizogenes TaxID=359 RepID=UPI001574271C|nr:hypothetical protein [Rhizobium rhizogenes]NTI22068.1 hypothetical protein [Rhizobium rhizogenes]QTG05669.1 hypothetical protein G6M87_09355 [Rhizobium rhizogenes]